MRRKPKTGEPRLQQKPLKLDAVPQELKDRIVAWRRREGKTWAQIAELATAALGKPVSDEAARRWFDLRIEQAEDRIRERAAASEKIAAAFAGAGYKNLSAAVRNALADKAFEVEQFASEGNEKLTQKTLLEFGWLLSALDKSDVQREKLDLEKEKLEARREALKAQDPREIYLAATEELLKRLRTRKALREALDPIQRELIEELSKSAESFAKRIEAQSAG